jgi:hypothetical protein
MSPLPEYKRVVNSYRCCAITFVVVWGLCIAFGVVQDTVAVFASIDNPPTTSKVVNGAIADGNNVSNWGPMSKLWFFTPSDNSDGGKMCFRDVAFTSPFSNAGPFEYFRQMPGTAPPSIYPVINPDNEVANFFYANISMLVPNYTVPLDSPFAGVDMYGIPQLWIKVDVATAACPPQIKAARNQRTRNFTEKVYGDDILIKFGTVDKTEQYTHEGQFKVSDQQTYVPLYITKTIIPQGGLYMGFEDDGGTKEHFHLEVGAPQPYKNELDPGVSNQIIIQVILRTRMVSSVYPVSLYERFNSVYGKMGGWLGWCFFVFGIIFVRIHPATADDDGALTMRCCKRRQHSPQQTQATAAGSLLDA